MPATRDTGVICGGGPWVGGALGPVCVDVSVRWVRPWDTGRVDRADTLAPAAEPAALSRWARQVSPALRAYAAVSVVSLLIALYLTWHLLGGFGQQIGRASCRERV